jgi:hypothetical protein
VGTNQWSRLLWNRHKNTKKFQFGNYVYGTLKEKKHIWANSKKDGLVHSGYNIILLVFINIFEPNPILVNVNKLKPYTYVDQTLKGIQSSKDHKSLQSINKDHMEETFNEDLENHKETNTIGTDQIVILEINLVNMISQQVMNKYLDHGYTISQLLDCGVDK